MRRIAMEAKRISLTTIGSRLSLLALGLIIGLVAAEGLGRALYIAPWYEQLVGEQLRGDWRASIQRNRWGMRDRDYPPDKPPGTTRILLLGDSFTYGSGVADDEAIFPALLERRLNEELHSHGRAVEILNGARPGSLTGKWLRTLREVDDSFRPDVIVVVFFIRDGTRTSAASGFFRPIRRRIAKANERSPLYQSLYLYRFYKDARDRDWVARRYSEALNAAYFGESRQTEEWQRAQANLREIQAIGRQAGAHTALVVFPVLVELNADHPFAAIGDLIEQFAVEAGMATHNLLPDFLGHEASELWVSPLNQHPNARGHELAAEALLPFFRRLLATAAGTEARS